MFGDEFTAGNIFNPNLVAAGPVSETMAFVLRYDGAARLDPSFGSGQGFVRGSFGLRSEFGTKFPVVGAMAGLVGPGGRKGRALAIGRLQPNGKLDPTFGTAGWLVTPVPAPLEVKSANAALDPQGRLLAAAGVTAPKQKNGYLLARFLIGP